MKDLKVLGKRSPAEQLVERVGNIEGINLRLYTTRDSTNWVFIVWFSKAPSIQDASPVMQRVCDLADELKVQLQLDVTQWRKKPGLIRYYKRFGFERTGEATQNSGTVMIRNPQ